MSGIGFRMSNLARSDFRNPIMPLFLQEHTAPNASKWKMQRRTGQDENENHWVLILIRRRMAGGSSSR
jgi:hypothetical protein